MVLLDTMGELGKLYSIGDVAFVGNSLLPPGGGHSLMEPLAQGVPVLHGPHVENFRQVAEDLKQNDLAIPVKNADEMKTAITSLLENAPQNTQLPKMAFSWIKSHQGASRRMADIIMETLKK